MVILVLEDRSSKIGMEIQMKIGRMDMLNHKISNKIGYRRYRYRPSKLPEEHRQRAALGSAFRVLWSAMVTLG